MIDRLESDGQVRRVASATDRRASYAQLTDHGLDALHSATEVHLVSLQRHFIEPLGAEGLEMLVTPLRRLRDALVGDPAQRIDGA